MLEFAILYGLLEPTALAVAGAGGQYFYGMDTIKIINKTWEHLASFAAHWLAQDCGEPNWCGGLDLDRDGALDLVDFAFFDGCCIGILSE